MDHISHRMILFPERNMYRTFLALILLNTVHSEFGGNFTLSFAEFPSSISFSPKGDKAYFVQSGAQAILEYENDGFKFEYRRNVTCPSIISFCISASGNLILARSVDGFSIIETSNLTLVRKETISTYLLAATLSEDEERVFLTLMTGALVIYTTNF
jgi:hypothetical protein